MVSRWRYRRLYLHGLGCLRGAAVVADERATAAVELALILPVFVLLMVFTIDFGGALYTKFRLDSAVSAAANYVVVNAASVNSTGGAGLASSVAGILSSSDTSAKTTATVIVNNGPTSTASSNGTAASGRPPTPTIPIARSRLPVS